MPFYYPNWINDFWRIMGMIHFGDKDHFCIPSEKRFDEAAIRTFCSEQGMAFYDTACEVRRLKDNASDAFLEVVTPTDIPALLARIPGCHTLVYWRKSQQPRRRDLWLCCAACRRVGRCCYCRPASPLLADAVHFPRLPAADGEKGGGVQEVS